jgi:hypothetical protein
MNEATNTVYAMNLGTPPSMSIFKGRP